MTRKEIIERYKVAEEAEIPDRQSLLLICINKSVTDPTLSVYDAVRYSWKISPAKAGKADYVLATAYGLIVGAYEVEGDWQEATEQNFSPGIPDRHGNWKKQTGRFGFHGHEASETIKKRYIGRRVPEALKGHGNPVRFVAPQA